MHAPNEHFWGLSPRGSLPWQRLRASALKGWRICLLVSSHPSLTRGSHMFLQFQRGFQHQLLTFCPPGSSTEPTEMGTLWRSWQQQRKAGERGRGSREGGHLHLQQQMGSHRFKHKKWYWEKQRQTYPVPLHLTKLKGEKASAPLYRSAFSCQGALPAESAAKTHPGWKQKRTNC